MARNISRADLDQRLAASLARIELSPEYRWRMVKRRRPKLDLSPVGMADKSLPIAIKELPPLMEERMDLMRLADFKPWMYPGLRPAARKTDDPGWLEWCIFPDARLVAEYADAHRPELAKVTREVAEEIRKRAGFWIRYRLSTAKGLSTDDVARCKAFISDALRGQGSGRVTHGRDTAEPEREWVNAMLKVRSPWGKPSSVRRKTAIGVVSEKPSQQSSPPAASIEQPSPKAPVPKLIASLRAVLSRVDDLLQAWTSFEDRVRIQRGVPKNLFDDWGELEGVITTKEDLDRFKSRRRTSTPVIADRKRIWLESLDDVAFAVRTLKVSLRATQSAIDPAARSMDGEAKLGPSTKSAQLRKLLLKLQRLVEGSRYPELPVTVGQGVDAQIGACRQSLADCMDDLCAIAGHEVETSDEPDPVREMLMQLGLVQSWCLHPLGLKPIANALRRARKQWKDSSSMWACLDKAEVMADCPLLEERDIPRQFEKLVDSAMRVATTANELAMAWGKAGGLAQVERATQVKVLATLVSVKESIERLRGNMIASPEFAMHEEINRLERYGNAIAAFFQEIKVARHLPASEQPPLDSSVPHTNLVGVGPWTQAALRKCAGISPSLFILIARAAAIKRGKSGDTTFTYGATSLRKLIAAAARGTSRQRKQAAMRWQELMDDTARATTSGE